LTQFACEKISFEGGNEREAIDRDSAYAPPTAISIRTVEWGYNYRRFGDFKMPEIEVFEITDENIAFTSILLTDRSGIAEKPKVQN
jgi:hypothetical protein